MGQSMIWPTFPPHQKVKDILQFQRLSLVAGVIRGEREQRLEICDQEEKSRRGDLLTTKLSVCDFWGKKEVLIFLGGKRFGC